MTLSQILSLVKAGYKASEIKALAADEAQTETVSPEEAPEIPAKEQEQPEEQKDTDAAEAEAGRLEIDKLNQRIKELESSLANTQRKNTQKDISKNKGADPQDPQDNLNNIVRSFM